jgi:CheY-like chemotaxis protein
MPGRALVTGFDRFSGIFLSRLRCSPDSLLQLLRLNSSTDVREVYLTPTREPESGILTSTPHPPLRSHFFLAGDSVRTIRTVIVDDSEFFLDSLEYYLTTVPFVEVVARASSGVEAIQKIRHCKPDLVFMDLRMPGMDGLSATRAIKKLKGAPAVIIVSINGHDEYGSIAEEAGAEAFVCKRDFAEKAIPLIQRFCLPREDLHG